MASVTTVELSRVSGRLEAPPFALLEHKGLVARLAEEVSREFRELSTNPSACLRALFWDEVKDARRRRRLQFGLACAVVAHIMLGGLIVALGWHGMFKPVEKEDGPYVVTIVMPPAPSNPPVLPSPVEQPGAKGEKTAGGGGGTNSPLPAKQGELPRFLPTPPIVSAIAPNANDPSALAVNPNIVGPETTPPPPAPLGDPNSKGTENSGGNGSGGGIGGPNGTGVGPTSGSGAGTGHGPGSSKKPGGEGGDGNDVSSGPIPWSTLARMPENSPFVWIHRPQVEITDEARKNKSFGQVLFKATFWADGRITDIRLINTDVPEEVEAALQSLQHSTFHPATVRGRRVTVSDVPVIVRVKPY